MKFCLKHIFTVKIKYRNRLPSEAVECPFLEILKTQLDEVLENQTQLTPLERGDWTGQPPVVPSNVSNFVTFSF